MPHSEDFVIQCLRLVDFDLNCSLATLVSRATNRNMKILIMHLPKEGDGTWYGEPLSDSELSSTTLKDVVVRMLDYESAYMGDTDIGWFNFGKPPSETRLRLRQLLSQPDIKPEALRAEFASWRSFYPW